MQNHDFAISMGEVPIKRKPLAPPIYDDTGVTRGVTPIPPSSPYLRPPLTTSASANTLPRYRSHPNLKAPNPPIQRAVTEAPIPPPRPVSANGPTASSAPATPAATPGPTPVQKAYGEARHFLGGLIAHPSESTKHHSILRHSPAIVLYRGSTTSVTVSIFADTPLPPDRSFWLQNKGWSGKTGMRTKAFFGMNDDWLNVTPSLALHADQVEPADERAWQRDIGKFRKKASTRVRDTHALRETVVARIPAETGDGYFQLVLCQGPKKKVLCTSPVFRILSTSFNPSSVRGASLSTLPLEVGAMVLGMYAQATAQRVIAPATAVQSRIQIKVKAKTPGFVSHPNFQKAYAASGVGDRFNTMMRRDGQERSIEEPLQFDPNAQFLDLGPQDPFPMDFKARAGHPVDLDCPRITLKAPDSITERLHGFFLVWARIDQPQSPQETQGWQQAILSIRNLDPTLQSRVNLSDAMRKTTALRFLEEISPPPGSRLLIRVMSFLRADVPAPTAMTSKDLLTAREVAAEAALLADACDIAYAQNTLDHPAWAPGAERGNWIERTKEGYDNVWARGQKMVDNVPLHWIGVRSAMAGARDKQVAVNGFYIVR